MGAWLTDQFSWNGKTSRDAYRRWLPLIIACEIMVIWGIAEFGRRGTIDPTDFGWWGLALATVWLPYFVGWVLLTGRRLRTAGITRSWLLLAMFVNIPIGDSFVTISMLASMILIAVAALAPDCGTATAV